MLKYKKYLKEKTLTLEDKIAVVTGGASGIGLDIAKSLKEEGATVIIMDIDEDKLSEFYNDFITYDLDLTNYELVEKTIEGIEKTVGKIDILVNNAGKIHSELLVNISQKDEKRHSYENFESVVRNNMHSTFIMGNIIADHMIMNRTKGVIINISSISADGNAGQTAYAAAKAGVNAMTVTWAKELGSFGIRCVGIAPGFINTPSTHNALSDDAINAIKSKTPLKKLGEAENISETVKFIIQNDYINGKIIEVDGGLTL